jgi:hypothetical protein
MRMVHRDEYTDDERPRSSRRATGVADVVSRSGS